MNHHAQNPLVVLADGIDAADAIQGIVNTMVDEALDRTRIDKAFVVATVCCAERIWNRYVHLQNGRLVVDGSYSENSQYGKWYKGDEEHLAATHGILRAHCGEEYAHLLRQTTYIFQTGQNKPVPVTFAVGVVSYARVEQTDEKDTANADQTIQAGKTALVDLTPRNTTITIWQDLDVDVEVAS